MEGMIWYLPPSSGAAATAIASMATTPERIVTAFILGAGSEDVSVVFIKSWDGV